VTIVNALLTNVSTPTKAQFFNAGDSSSMLAEAVSNGAEKHKVESIVAAGGESVVSVDAMSLDYAAKRHNVLKVAFIKVDVQGHEFEVLMGSLSTRKLFAIVAAICSCSTRLSVARFGS
jgi:FkbM family methyltransferase